MSKPSKAEFEACLQELAALRTGLSDSKARAHRPLKPIALTLRLDPARYTRLSAHAAEFTPRRSFQTIIVAALDAYLGE